MVHELELASDLRLSYALGRLGYPLSLHSLFLSPEIVYHADTCGQEYRHGDDGERLKGKAIFSLGSREDYPSEGLKQLEGDKICSGNIPQTYILTASLARSCSPSAQSQPEVDVQRRLSDLVEEPSILIARSSWPPFAQIQSLTAGNIASLKLTRIFEEMPLVDVAGQTHISM